MLTTLETPPRKRQARVKAPPLAPMPPCTTLAPRDPWPVSRALVAGWLDPSVRNYWRLVWVSRHALARLGVAITD